MPLTRVVACAMGVLVLAGCGGDGHHVAVALGPVTPVAVAPRPAPTYYWMVRTAGRPPSVAAENAAAGTSAWRLPGPRKLIGGVVAMTRNVLAHALSARRTRPHVSRRR